MPYLGISFGMEEGVIYKGKKVEGLRILGVERDGPSERGGLFRGDLILAINDEPFPAGAKALVVKGRVQALPVGEKITITIRRDKKVLKVRMRPGVKESTEAERAERVQQFERWLAGKMKPVVPKK